MKVEKELVENCRTFEEWSMSAENTNKFLLAYFAHIDNPTAYPEPPKKHLYIDRWTFSVEKLKEFCDKIGIEFYYDDFNRNYLFVAIRERDAYGWGDALESALKRESTKINSMGRTTKGKFTCDFCSEEKKWS